MEYLALTVLGKNKPGLANELTKLISISKCNIINCQVLTLGGEFNANFLLSGTWDTLAKFETHLPLLEQKHEFQTLRQRTEANKILPNSIPYVVYVIAVDNLGLIYQLTNFFEEQQVVINEVKNELYTARHSNVTMCSLSISISVPDVAIITELRERFLIFCDRFNFDGIIEPEKI